MAEKEVALKVPEKLRLNWVACERWSLKGHWSECPGTFRD